MWHAGIQDYRRLEVLSKRATRSEPIANATMTPSLNSEVMLGRHLGRVAILSEILRMNWVKALLLLSCLLVGYADLVTTNVILNHGLGELNPFMRLAQTWLGAWWLIPKLSLTFAVMWLLSRSNKLYHIAFAIALFSTPVLNNLIIIAGMK